MASSKGNLGEASESLFQRAAEWRDRKGELLFTFDEINQLKRVPFPLVERLLLTQRLFADLPRADGPMPIQSWDGEDEGERPVGDAEVGPPRPPVASGAGALAEGEGVLDEDQPAEDQPAEDQPAEDQPAEDQQAEDQQRLAAGDIAAASEGGFDAGPGGQETHSAQAEVPQTFDI